MTTHMQHVFDFPRFALTLPGLPSYDMLEAVREEIKYSSTISPDDPVIKFKQMVYGKKLERLRSFLQTFELPAGMPPREQEAYQAIVGELEAEGLLIRKPEGRANHVPLDGNVATWWMMATDV